MLMRLQELCKTCASLVGRPVILCETPKFPLARYMQLTCSVHKLLHFKREIADDKILHFDLGAKAPGISRLGPTSLESPFDADVKVRYICDATKHRFCDIRDLLAPSRVDTQNSAIPEA